MGENSELLQQLKQSIARRAALPLPHARTPPAIPAHLSRPIKLPVNVDGLHTALVISCEDDPEEAAALFLAKHGCAAFARMQCRAIA